MSNCPGTSGRAIPDGGPKGAEIMAGVQFQLERNLPSDAPQKPMTTEKLSRTFSHRYEQISTTSLTHSSALVNYSWEL
jgi:hypothetical protein